jgi:hypothetical protein
LYLERRGKLWGTFSREGDDLKRIHRTDLLSQHRLVNAKIFGIFREAYKDTRIKVEIKKG